MLEWIIYCAICRIIVFLWQKFPLEELTKNKFLTKLHECSLCSGVWIFFFFALLFQVDLLKILGFQFYYPLLNESITGGISSFLVWLIVKGWKSAFSPDIIRL